MTSVNRPGGAAPSSRRDERAPPAVRRPAAATRTHLRVEQVGEALHLSKSHLGAIYRKLGVCRRSDAVTSVLRHGVLEAHG